MDNSNIEELIDNISSEDFNNANKSFADLLNLKMNDALEQEKVRLADTIFNGVEDMPEEDDDAEELELSDQEEQELLDDEDLELLDDEEFDFEDEEL